MAELCRVVRSYAATYGSDYSPVFIRPHWGTDCAAEHSATSLTHYFNFSAKTFFGNPTRDSVQQQCVIIPRSNIIFFLLNNGLLMHWFLHSKVSLHVLVSTCAYVKQVDVAWVSICGADTFKNEKKKKNLMACCPAASSWSLLQASRWSHRREGCQAIDHSSRLCFNICDTTGDLSGHLHLETSPAVFVSAGAGILSQHRILPLH